MEGFRFGSRAWRGGASRWRRPPICWIPGRGFHSMRPRIVRTSQRRRSGRWSRTRRRREIPQGSTGCGCMSGRGEWVDPGKQDSAWRHGMAVLPGASSGGCFPGSSTATSRGGLIAVAAPAGLLATGLFPPSLRDEGREPRRPVWLCQGLEPVVRGCGRVNRTPRSGLPACSAKDGIPTPSDQLVGWADQSIAYGFEPPPWLRCVGIQVTQKPARRSSLPKIPKDVHSPG